VPYERNPFFTGREEDIQRLEEALAVSHTTALTQIQAISGLGGIGKTQTAVEYAYRHRDDYSAVFWTAADTTASLTTGFVEIARLLQLPQAQEADESLAVEAVKRWLETNDGWLLIADNADRPELLKDFRPRRMSGHLLLTSRAQVFDMLGVARPVALETMSPEEALDFLFTRTGRDECTAEEKVAAAQLATELGYLPLALEQAGAYITANQARFQDYLESYRQRRLELLEKRAPIVGNYPSSVATTWAINFAEVTATSAASADLLRVSAYLNPDSIPLELLTEGGSELGEALSAALTGTGDNPLAVDEVLEPLLRYSLVSRDIELHAYSIHRLVQTVIQAEISKEKQEQQWAQRVVRALNETFKYTGYESWPDCGRLIPHVEVAAKLIERDGILLAEAARLLSGAGVYYQSRGQYKAAEMVLKLALHINEETLDPRHGDLATGLTNLAVTYASQGKYDDAEPLYKQALSIMEEARGVDDFHVAVILNNLAELYLKQDKYDDAEPLYKRALNIREEELGPNDLAVATGLNNLGLLLDKQGKFSEAEPLLKRALDIRQKGLSNTHPYVAQSLSNLAGLYTHQDRYDEAEPLLQWALRIREERLGTEHLDVANSLNLLSELFISQGKFADAKPLTKRALHILEEVLGPEHPDFVDTFEMYTKILRVLNYLKAVTGSPRSSKPKRKRRWRRGRRPK
jgi:tetratricopeptide (TPR) repeat protein